MTAECRPDAGRLAPRWDRVFAAARAPAGTSPAPILTVLRTAPRGRWPDAPSVSAQEPDVREVANLLPGLAALALEVGGEPLAAWRAVLEEAARQGVLVRVFVRGEGVGPESLAGIDSAVVPLEWPHGHRYDARRGSGAFAEALIGLRRLVEAAPPGGVTVAAPVWANTAPLLPELVHRVHALGVSRLAVFAVSGRDGAALVRTRARDAVARARGTIPDFSVTLGHRPVGPALTALARLTPHLGASRVLRTRGPERAERRGSPGPGPGAGAGGPASGGVRGQPPGTTPFEPTPDPRDSW